MNEDDNTQRDYSRFDFEQDIMHCWSLIDDIKIFAQRDDVNQDQWMALAAVYEVKFSHLFEQFEIMIKRGLIR